MDLVFKCQLGNIGGDRDVFLILTADYSNATLNCGKCLEAVLVLPTVDINGDKNAVWMYLGSSDKLTTLIINMNYCKVK